MPVTPRCRMPELPTDVVIEIDVFLASSECLSYGAAAT